MFNGKTASPLIVPIFIPNQGCPHRCIFCEQEKITDSSTRPVSELTIKKIIEKAVKSTGFFDKSVREIAFYGGTFTRLPTEKMKKLLRVVSPYLRQGLFSSIRVSTRPDSLDENRLDLLKDFSVSTVELGAQSMDDNVLKLSQRGHTVKDIIESFYLLRERGFKVGIQLMPGLPGDSEEKFMTTVKEVVKLRPDMARLYPAIVINGTELARWYNNGQYRPLQLDEAVKICRESCLLLEERGIPVIRIGLMSSQSLLEKGQIIAGPWHTAFGFIVRSGIYQKKITHYLPGYMEAEEIRLRVPGREIPLVRGYKNLGLRLIEEKTGAKVAGIVPDESVPAGQVEVDII